MTPTARIPRRPSVPLLAVLAAAGLAACTLPVGSTADRAAATPKAMAACRQRADEVYDRQNRGDVYRSDMYAGGQRDAPFGAALAGGPAGGPGDGLSARYARETMVDDCLNGMSGVTETPPPDAAPAPSPAAVSPRP